MRIEKDRSTAITHNVLFARKTFEVHKTVCPSIENFFELLDLFQSPTQNPPSPKDSAFHPSWWMLCHDPSLFWQFSVHLPRPPVVGFQETSRVLYLFMKICKRKEKI